jgi:GNAT superfamily N-acetyltransferase
MEIRDAQAGEADRLAQLWYDGWCDAHLRIVPAELTRVRTPESFRERMRAAINHVRVAGPSGAPLGFHLLKDDELYQLYVSAAARGTGVAAALIADAEARLAGRGVQTAWLGCAIGNERAARFYEKCGWHRARTIVSDLETIGGIVRLEVWRYEKTLKR